MKKRVIVNPVFQDTVEFLETSEETSGKHTLLEVKLSPGGENLQHIHNAFTEVFTAVKGTLGLKLDRETVLLEPGNTHAVLRKEAHNFFNPGKEEIVFRIKFNPGHEGMENTLRIAYGLAADGKVDKKGLPKNLQVAALIMDMSNTYPVGFLGLLRPFLSLLARKARRNGLEAALVKKYCI